MDDQETRCYAYLEKLLDARERAILARLDGMDKAITVARDALDYRLEGMNELRAQITGERGLYLTRERYEASYAALEERLQRLESALAEYRGRLWMLGTGLTALVIVLQLVIRLIITRGLL